jgi:hypothetical protein
MRMSRKLWTVYRFHRICCFFTIRFATISMTADSTNPVETAGLFGNWPRTIPTTTGELSWFSLRRVEFLDGPVVGWKARRGEEMQIADTGASPEDSLAKLESAKQWKETVLPLNRDY